MSVTFDSLADDKLVVLLVDGGVGVLPTDTVYGLVCRAADQTAVTRLYALKSRVNNPGPVIAASIDQIVELGIKRRYLNAVSHYWPNQISIEIPHGISYLNQDTGRQAFRVVKDKKLAKFLEKTGPLVTSSANLPDQPEAPTITEAKKYFGESVDFYVDGGDLSGRPASTLIRVVDDIVDVVREGAVKVNEKGEIV